MKFICRALLISIILLTWLTPVHAKIKVSVFGDESYEPYCFEHNGTYDGIYVRILQKAFSRMERYEVEINSLPWKRVLLGMEKGKFFAIFPPYYRPQLRPWIDIYSTPILEEGYELFCRKEVLDKPRPNWPEDYHDLQIGSNLGFAVPRINEITHQEAASSAQNVKKLLQGKIDCYANNDKSTLYLINQLGGNASLIKSGVKISVDYGYLAFSRKNNPPFKKHFIRQFNKIITKMKENGEIDKIVDEFFN